MTEYFYCKICNKRANRDDAYKDYIVSDADEGNPYYDLICSECLEKHYTQCEMCLLYFKETEIIENMSFIRFQVCNKCNGHLLDAMNAGIIAGIVKKGSINIVVECKGDDK